MHSNCCFSGNGAGYSHTINAGVELERIPGAQERKVSAPAPNAGTMCTPYLRIRGSAINILLGLNHLSA